MVDKLLIGAAVWLASNPTGRKVAMKSYKILSKLGDSAVKAMPDDISGVFRSAEKLITGITNDGSQNK